MQPAPGTTQTPSDQLARTRPRRRWGIGRTAPLAATLVLALVACGGSGDEGSTGGADDGDSGGPTTTADLALGEQVFADNCASCHGPEGSGDGIGPDLSQVDDVDLVRTQVREGEGQMPAFGSTLSDEEIAAVSAFVVQELGDG